MPGPCKLPLAFLLLALTAPAASIALPASNPANKLLERGLDPVRYDRATKCTKSPAKGMLALQSWLERNSAGSSWGIMRCERWGRNSASLHAEGRAIDWHLDARVAAQKRAAERLIALLLAPDKAGNPVALARRMGIQGIIFDCRSWFGGRDGAMGRYSACYAKNGKRKKVDPTTAHKDHVHIELNKLGAAKRTTFWNAKVTWPTELEQTEGDHVGRTHSPVAGEERPVAPQAPANVPSAPENPQDDWDRRDWDPDHDDWDRSDWDWN